MTDLPVSWGGGGGVKDSKKWGEGCPSNGGMILKRGD